MVKNFITLLLIHTVSLKSIEEFVRDAQNFRKISREGGGLKNVSKVYWDKLHTQIFQ